MGNFPIITHSSSFPMEFFFLISALIFILVVYGIFQALLRRVNLEDGIWVTGTFITLGIKEVIWTPK